MTQTIAQNLLINSISNNRNTNYGKHPKEVFNELDKNIIDNKVYNNIISNLNKLEINYNTSIEELDTLIAEAKFNYSKLKEQEALLNQIPFYIYNIPNITTYINMIKDISRLINDCNLIINNIITKNVNNVGIYASQIILSEINLSLKAIVTKEWLYNYLSVQNVIPTKVNNAILICNSNGQIQWQS